MGNSTRSAAQTQLTQIATPKYWCYQCQIEINKPTTDMTCPQCKTPAIQQITSSNDPRSHDVFTLQSEINEPQPQQPAIINTHANPNFITQQVNLGPGGLRITMMNNQPGIGIPLNFDQLSQNLQNMLNMMMQNGQSTNPASAEQLALLQMCEVQECAVCQGEGGEGLKLGCQHVFHSECIMPWLNKKDTCPTCRTELKRT